MALLLRWLKSTLSIISTISFLVSVFIQGGQFGLKCQCCTSICAQNPAHRKISKKKKPNIVVLINITNSAPSETITEIDADPLHGTRTPCRRVYVVAFYILVHVVCPLKGRQATAAARQLLPGQQGPMISTGYHWVGLYTNVGHG